MVKNGRKDVECSNLKMSNETIQRQLNTLVIPKHHDKFGSTVNSNGKSTRRKALYMELGLEDSNSCTGDGISESLSNHCKSKNRSSDLAFSIGLSISDSSEDETENS